MFRGRVLLLALLATAAVAASVASARPSGHFTFTHRAVYVGTFVDHWTINQTGSCGLVGDGTLTVSFRYANPKGLKVHLYYDKFAGQGGELLGAGNWVVGVPGGAGVTQASKQPAVGTITLVDHTVQNAPDEGETCTKPTEDCGTTPLAKATISLTGYDIHRLLTDLPKTRFGLKGGSGRQVRCPHGQPLYFDDTDYVGRAADGELVIPMVSQSTVAHRRVFKVTGHSHRKFSGDCDRDIGSCSDDVTRNVTVTFKRL